MVDGQLTDAHSNPPVSTGRNQSVEPVHRTLKDAHGQCFVFWINNYTCGKFILQHVGEHLTTVNALSVDRIHWFVGCSWTAILSVVSLSIPWTEIKFWFHLRSPRRWSANPWGCPWLYMIVKQPSISQPSTWTVKYKIFNWITCRPWASMSIRLLVETQL